MLNPNHFRELIIDPTLKYIDLYSQAASDLLLGTAIVESRLVYLKQLGGPALGVYQIEPATHQDVWNNYLGYRKAEMLDLIGSLIFNSAFTQKTPDIQLITNLAYATAIARVIYLRVPEPLPNPDDVNYWLNLAGYWKNHYNTHLGKGTPEKFIQAVSDANRVFPLDGVSKLPVY